MVAIVARSFADGPDDVTLVQFRALVVLRADPATNLGQLAAALGVTPSSATRMCDRLVDRGLIDRADAPDNRREIRLRLTAAGRRLVDRATRIRRRHLQTVLAAMPAEERDRLVPVLEAFTDATASTLGMTWPGAEVIGDPEG
jgi:DNA-binding MarR family transcriptional regulator